MKHPVLALLGLLAVAAAPIAQAVEILRWERMPPMASANSPTCGHPKLGQARTVGL